MVMRISPSGPVALVGDLPVGTNGQQLITSGTQAAWASGRIVANTVAEVEAMPLFDADLVTLRGRNAANDLAGGDFVLLPNAGGFVADDFDVIALGGVHAPQHLFRVSDQPWNITWTNSNSTATPLVINTPAFCLADHFGFGQGPWTKSGPEQLTWLGQDDTIIFVAISLELTGTAGDRIVAGMSPVVGGPVVNGTVGGVIGVDGTLQLAGTDLIPLDMGTEIQLAYENRTGSNAVVTASSLIRMWKVKGNQATTYV